jgi:hypothetical protein
MQINSGFDENFEFGGMGFLKMIFFYKKKTVEILGKVVRLVLYKNRFHILSLNKSPLI